MWSRTAADIATYRYTADTDAPDVVTTVLRSAGQISTSLSADYTPNRGIAHGHVAISGTKRWCTSNYPPSSAHRATDTDSTATLVSLATIVAVVGPSRTTACTGSGIAVVIAAATTATTARGAKIRTAPTNATSSAASATSTAAEPAVPANAVLSVSSVLPVPSGVNANEP